MRYIDADKIEYVPAVESGFYRNENHRVGGEFTVAMFTSKDQIDAIPTADVKPVRHSKFQGDHILAIYDTRVCFSCKRRVPVDNFCIHCGAKMDGKEVDSND